jgi:hypothetical protein
MGQSIESLALPQRLEVYRHSAEEAFRRAHEAGNEAVRAEFFAMAARWHLLAVEIERAMKAADLASSPRDEELEAGTAVEAPTRRHNK